MTTVHITNASKNGKMEGIPSINTSTLNNSFCTGMRANLSHQPKVCEKCYAATFEQHRSNLGSALQRNSILLSTKVIPKDELPDINALVFRFSSFGELENDVHFTNLVNICWKNPNTFFSLWTKRADIVQAYLQRNLKPKNLNLIYSSPFFNKEHGRPTYFDKVFTVYTVEPEGINCHSKCKDCMLCYTKNATVHIREMVKKPKRKTKA